MSKMKLMMVSFLYLLSMNFAMAGSLCDSFVLSIHNKQQNSLTVKVFRDASSTSIPIPPGAPTKLPNKFSVTHPADIEVFDVAGKSLFKGEISKAHKTRELKCIPYFDEQQAYIPQIKAGKISFVTISGHASEESNDAGSCLNNTPGLYTLVVG